MHTENSKKKGFTLMELLLYVGIASIMLFIISLLLSTLLQSRIKNQSIIEVEQQGQFVIQQITQALRNGKEVSNPQFQEEDASLSLITYSVDESPTLFYIDEGIIYIKEGSDEAIPLTNSRIQASNLSFSNLTHVDSPEFIRISFTLGHDNPQDRTEYDFSRTFFASASLRQP